MAATAQKCDPVPASVYVPLFSSADADMVLRSLEGSLYRVRTCLLRSSSCFFDTMFNLPQNDIQHDHAGHPRSETILDVYENDFALKPLLCLMSGISVMQWETVNAFECVLRLAEKWDTPGPMDLLRCDLTAHQLIQSHPLRCYYLATHFGWKAEAKLASTYSLTIDIFDSINRDTLCQLLAKDLLSLLNLHRKRQVVFLQLLHCPQRFVAGNSPPYYCQSCGITELDDSAWRNFKDRLISEMERRPMGDTLEMGAECWPEAQACWEARCSRQDCGALAYDKSMTLRQIEACVALLPKTIGYED